MEDGWADRLKAAIAKDGRSPRKLSLDAGLGPNYLEQTFSRGSAPTQNKLAAVMDQLGQDAALYIYTGVEMDRETLRFIQLLSDAPAPLRQSVLDLLERMTEQTSGDPQG